MLAFVGRERDRAVGERVVGETPTRLARDWESALRNPLLPSALKPCAARADGLRLSSNAAGAASEARCGGAAARMRRTKQALVVAEPPPLASLPELSLCDNANDTCVAMMP